MLWSRDGLTSQSWMMGVGMALDTVVKWLACGVVLAMAGGCAGSDHEDWDATERMRTAKTGPFVVVDGEPVGVAEHLSGFALAIDGLPTDNVLAVEEFIWEESVGEDGMLTTSVPNLKITISMADIDPWADWLNNDDERQGSLSVLGPDHQEELMTIDFAHLGIISLEEEAVEAKKPAISRMTAELYCEEMFFSTLSD